MLGELLIIVGFIAILTVPALLGMRQKDEERP
jgi:hypothetical protein